MLRTHLLLALLAPAAAGAQLPYAESFDGTDGDPWPAPWTTMSFYVTEHDLQGDRARLGAQAANGSGVILGRMLLTGFLETDVEATMTLEFEDAANQGIGFYARQNGGTLQEYLPHGQGYAMFLKGGWIWPEDLGIWREIDGQEMQFATGYNPVAGGLQNGVRYRTRFRVTQHGADSTLIQAKVWPESGSEPGTWTVEAFDTSPELQNTPGGFALDLYNAQGTAHVFVDDLLITEYPGSVGIPPSERLPRISLAVPSPHPAGRAVGITCSAPHPVRAAVGVFDVSGRRVAEVFDGTLAPGDTSLRWIPEAPSGGALSAGVYFVRLAAPSTAVVRRIVLTGR